jgi:hypothetical protein
MILAMNAKSAHDVLLLVKRRAGNEACVVTPARAFQAMRAID